VAQVFVGGSLGGKKMKNPSGSLINIIATGIVVTIFLSLPLFLGRWLCNSYLVNNISEQFKQIIISPSGLYPGEPAPQQVDVQSRDEMPPGPNEPNFRFSRVYAGINREYVMGEAFGVVWDIIAETKPYRDANERIYYWNESRRGYICFDKRSGLIIRRYQSVELKDKRTSREEELFAGPNGVSKTAEPSLGRFYDFITTQQGPNQIGIYDKGTRQFCVIDFIEGSVSKGVQLAQGDMREPIAMGRIEKGYLTASVWWNPPEIWDDAQGRWKGQRLFWPGGVQSGEGYRFSNWDWTCTYIPVLDKTGRIYNYDTKQQSLTPAGYLPFPKSTFTFEPHDEVSRPGDVLAYGIWPVYAYLRSPSELTKPRGIIDIKYLGICVACVSREGKTMSAAVFDPNGKLVYRGDSQGTGAKSAEAVYSGAPDAELVKMILFLIENLQPPVFEIASYLSKDTIEAEAGHRALFILPNSFVGMLGRYTGLKFDREVFLPLLMGPSLILSIWLAMRIRKDAKLTGISNRAGKWWMIGTMAFGLPAYITYRLTRHKEVLITCQNCGKLRRPDMETCHRCGSKWEIPDLIPPDWRICD
jgi:hypothetical protein